MHVKSRLARAVDLVKAFEVFEPRAVRRPDGGWSIGYGHTRTAREGAEVSREDAEALLLYDLAHVAAVVERDVQVRLSANQLGALTAFAFNIGWDRFRRSTVLERLNGGDVLGAAEQIERWRLARVTDGPEVVDALVRRRVVEKARFLTPAEGFPRSATPLTPPEYDPAPELPRRPSAAPAAEAASAEEPPPPPVARDPDAGGYRPPPAANESHPFPAPRSEASPGPVVPSPLTAWLGAAAEPPGPTPRRRRIAYLALGALGLLLFAASVYLILAGRPAGANLLVGLVGVLLMTPAAYALMGRDGVGD